MKRALVLSVALGSSACSGTAPAPARAVLPEPTAGPALHASDVRIEIANGAARPVFDYKLTEIVDGGRAVVVNDRSAVAVFDLPDLRLRARYPTGHRGIDSIDVGHGSVFVVRSNDRNRAGAIDVIDARRGVLVAEERAYGYGHGGSVVFALAGDDSRFAMAAADESGVLLVELASGKRVTLEPPPAIAAHRFLSSLAFDQRAATLDAAWTDGSSKRYEVGQPSATPAPGIASNQEPLRGGTHVPIETTDARCAGAWAFAIDSERRQAVAFSSKTKTLCLVELQRRGPSRVLATRSTDVDVGEARFLPDGKSVAVRDLLGDARGAVFALPTLEPRGTFAGFRVGDAHGHLEDGPQKTLAFFGKVEPTTDRGTLYVLGEDASLRSAEVPPGEAYTDATGRWLVWAQHDGGTRLLDTKTMRWTPLQVGHERTRYRVGSDVVVGRSDAGHLRVWELASGKLVAEVAPPARHVAALRFTRPGVLAVASAELPTTQVLGLQQLDLATGARETTGTSSTDFLDAVTLLPSGEAVHLWSSGVPATRYRVVGGAARAGVELAPAPKDERGIRFAVSADGARAITSGDRSTHVWDLTTGRRLSQIDREWRPEDVAISPDGRRVVLAGHRLELLDADGTVLGTNDASPDADWRALAFDDTGTRFAALAHDHLAVFEAADLKLVREWTIPGRETFEDLRIAFSRDGRRLAIVRPLQVFDLQSGEMRMPPAARPLDEHVASVAFTPDGALLAAGTVEGTIELRRSRDLGLVGAIRTAHDAKGAVAWSADGTFQLIGDAAEAQRYVRCYRGNALVAYDACKPNADAGLLARLLRER